MLIYVYYETKISVKEKKNSCRIKFFIYLFLLSFEFSISFPQFDKIIYCRIPKIIHIIERINVINRISFLYNLVFDSILINSNSFCDNSSILLVV